MQQNNNCTKLKHKITFSLKTSEFNTHTSMRDSTALHNSQRKYTGHFITNLYPVAPALTISVAAYRHERQIHIINLQQE